MGDESSKDKRLATLSAEGRKLVGQAIIDGLLTPAAVIGVTRMQDYGQNAGDYNQRGGGDHRQGGNGNYNQAPMNMNPADIVSIVAQIGAVIREE